MSDVTTATPAPGDPTGVTAAGCPLCPHCTEEAAAKRTVEQAATASIPAQFTVAAIRRQLRPWEFVGYGSKITAIVDWYDGWWVGTNADTNDADVPAQIIDKRQWVSGFTEGWHDAAKRRAWSDEHAEAI